MTPLTIHLNDEAATLALGARLARSIMPGLHIVLHGDLGAGKTTLVRGLLRALGHAGAVKSPSYSLVEPYALPDMTFNHFDLYRFRDESEWHDNGFGDYFGPTSVCAVEWPEKAADLLPPADLDISLVPRGSGRDACIKADTAAGGRCLETLRLLSADAVWRPEGSVDGV